MPLLCSALKHQWFYSLLLGTLTVNINIIQKADNILVAPERVVGPPNGLQTTLGGLPYYIEPQNKILWKTI